MPEEDLPDVAQRIGTRPRQTAVVASICNSKTLPMSQGGHRQSRSSYWKGERHCQKKSCPFFRTEASWNRFCQGHPTIFYFPGQRPRCNTFLYTPSWDSSQVSIQWDVPGTQNQFQSNSRLCSVCRCKCLLYCYFSASLKIWTGKQMLPFFRSLKSLLHNTCSFGSCPFSQDFHIVVMTLVDNTTQSPILTAVLMTPACHPRNKVLQSLERVRMCSLDLGLWWRRCLSWKPSVTVLPLQNSFRCLFPPYGFEW